MYLASLGARPLVAPDEVRYAEIAREMLVSGDWIVPHLDGLRYFEKPVLGHWLNALSAAVLGFGAFAVRLPSALAVGATAAGLALLVRRGGGSLREATLSAGLLLTCGLVYGIGVSAVLDSLLSLFASGALISFFLSFRAQAPRRRDGWLALAGLLCGLGVLTKGFIAVAVCVTAALPFVVLERRLLEFARRSWIPLAAAIAVVLPWAVSVHLREPDFWRYFVLIEHLQRFASDRAQHPRPFWFFVPILLLGLLPWTPLVPAALAGLRSRRFDALDRFCLCWFVGPLVLFSLSRGKLATYALPCLPPLCIALARGLLLHLRAGNTRRFRGGALALAGLAGLVAAAVLLDRTLLPLGSLHDGLSRLRWGLLLAALVPGALLALQAARAASGAAALGWYASAALPGLVLAGWMIPPDAGSRLAPVELLSRHASDAGPDPLVVADWEFIYAANLAFETDRVQTLRRGELAYGLSYEDAGDRFISAQSVTELALDPARTRALVLLATRDKYAALSPRLPQADTHVVDGDLVLGIFRGALPGAGSEGRLMDHSLHGNTVQP